MAFENLKRVGLSSTTSVYFVGTRAPVPIVDETGHVIAYEPGQGYMKTDYTTSPFNLLTGYRQSAITPGFNSGNRPSLLRALSFEYSKTDQSASSYNSVQSFPISPTTGPGTAGYEASQTFTTNVVSGSFPIDTSADWVSQLTGKASANLLSQLRDSSFNAAQAVAERKQTANLVASTATKVAKAFGSLRKGNFVKAATDLGVIPKKRAGRRFNKDYPVDQAKAVGNAWLELQYGWKPLLSDVYGSMETMAKANNPPSGNPNTIFKKMTARAKRTESPYKRTDFPLGTAVGSWYEISQGVVECHVKIGVTYAISSPALTSMAKVGITNPALLAWELLPYSFVVDWFLPIGNYLSSLDATAGLLFVDGYVTVYRKYRGTYDTMKGYSSASGYKRYSGTSSGQKTSFLVKRTPLGGFPSAPLPSFKNPLSSSHVASAMALLLQNFKR